MTLGKDWARSYFLAVLIGWVLLGVAGLYMARTREIPVSVAGPIIAAFLLEWAFYLVPGFEELRHWLSDKIPIRTLAFAIALSGIAPYLLYSIPTGQFRQVALVRLSVPIFVLCFWYVFRRPTWAGDLAILALVASTLTARLFFRQISLSPHPAVPGLEILGKLMLFRLVPTVMLIVREIDGTGFGFVPTAREWKVGFRYFALFLPIGIGFSAIFKLFAFKFTLLEFALAPLVFAGFFLTVALAEEFLARGLLQRWISDWTGNQNLALILASCAFGLAHLWFSPGYPNWKMAIIAAIAGWFYGKAYLEGGGVRASAITHALVITTWRTLS